LIESKAFTTTARKIAVLFYNAQRYGMDYVDPGASSYQSRYRARVIDNFAPARQSLRLCPPTNGASSRFLEQSPRASIRIDPTSPAGAPNGSVIRAG
jgi:hypothetical protein